MAFEDADLSGRGRLSLWEFKMLAPLLQLGQQEALALHFAQPLEAGLGNDCIPHAATVCHTCSGPCSASFLKGVQGVQRAWGLRRCRSAIVHALQWFVLVLRVRLVLYEVLMLLVSLSYCYFVYGQCAK